MDTDKIPRGKRTPPGPRLGSSPVPHQNDTMDNTCPSNTSSEARLQLLFSLLGVGPAGTASAGRLGARHTLHALHDRSLLNRRYVELGLHKALSVRELGVCTGCR